jgi:hypothetical protein
MSIFDLSHCLKGSVQLLNGLCEGILKGSEDHGEKIVKNRQKEEEVRQNQVPNPL